MAGGSSKDGAPNLTPLLDVVLQLIMFFMITVNFVRVDQLNEEVNLPVAQSATPLDQKAEDWIFLNMNKNGELVGTAEDLSTDGRLQAFLQRERDKLAREAQAQGRHAPNIVVVLRADKDSRYEKVYSVLDRCSRAGYQLWQLRVLKSP